MITFLDFCSHLSVPLTPAQRVLALVAFDSAEPHDLEGEERELARQLFGDVETIPSPARAVLVLVLGARSGKSYIFGALYSLWRALTADLRTLAPGELAVALVVSIDLRLGRQTLRYALGAAKRHMRSMVQSETSDGFVLRRSDGREVSIEVLPASRGGAALRGRSLVSAVLDEAAFFRDESAVVNDAEIFKAVAPRVLPGGLVVLCSTPWLEQGLLHELFETNFGAPKTALAAHGPTLLLLNSTRNIDAVERERERDPDNARREFGAEFVLGGTSLVFPPDLLREVFASEDMAPAKTSDMRAVIGGDIGLVSDSSAFCALLVRRNVVSYAAELELRPKKGAPLKLSEVVAQACTFADRFEQKTIHVDHHVLAAAREHLPAGFHLAPVPGGQAAKAERFLRTAQLMKEGQLVAPRLAVRLKSQLAEVQSKMVPGGGLQVFQPRRGGAHGDVASAFVVAAWRAGRPVFALSSSTARDRPERPLRDNWRGTESELTGY